MTRAQAVWLVALAALVAHATVVFGGWLDDDVHAVRDNVALRSLTEIPRYFVDASAFSAMRVEMYRPVVLTSLAIDGVVAGWFAAADGSPAAAVFKLTDLFLHALCSVLVLVVARRLRARPPAALLAALVFAVHPLASEALHLVSSRSDQLVAIGALVAVRLHLAALAGSRAAPWGVAAAVALACGSKESGVMIPVVLVVVDHARRRREQALWPWAAGVARRLAPSAVVLVLYLAARRAVLGVATAAVPKLTAAAGGAAADVTTGHGRDLLTQLCTMAKLLPELLGKAIVPLGLSADPAVDWSANPVDPAVLAGLAALAAWTAAGLLVIRRRPACAVGTTLAWAVALPWVLVPLNHPASEHRLYGVLAGLALVLAGAVRPRRRRSFRHGTRSPRFAVGLAAGIVVAMTVGSWARGSMWLAPERLWADALAGNPESHRARSGLAQVACARAERAFAGGRRDVAAAELTIASRQLVAALWRHPRNEKVQRQLVKLELARGAEGRTFLAVVVAEALVERRPRNPFYRLDLAVALANCGERSGEATWFADGVRAALGVLDVAEPKGRVYRVAAGIERRAGRPAAALTLLDTSLARGLDHADVRVDRADVLLDLGRRDDARAALADVLATDPFHPGARGVLARCREPRRLELAAPR